MEDDSSQSRQIRAAINGQLAPSGHVRGHMDRSKVRSREKAIIAVYLAGGISQVEVGRRFGVCQATVSGILRNANIKAPSPKHRANAHVEVTPVAQAFPIRCKLPGPLLPSDMPYLYHERQIDAIYGRYRDVVFQRRAL
jgi:hypothetical protein